MAGLCRACESKAPGCHDTSKKPRADGPDGVKLSALTLAISRGSVDAPAINLAHRIHEAGLVPIMEGDGMGSGLTQEEDYILSEMVKHVDGVEEVFRPSVFWATFKEANLAQLRASGLYHFKRTINQNYFNWILDGPSDNQFRSLLRLTAEYPSIDAFKVDILGDTKAESFFLQDPLGGYNDKLLYSLFVGMLWQYTALSYPNGLTEALEEPSLGRPFPTYLQGKRISQDLANSIRERNVICWPWEPSFEQRKQISFVEIGAGYGRLGYVFLKSAPVKYTIVDIPPALFVSQWYLPQLFPEKRVFSFSPWHDVDSVIDDFQSADIAFLTPDQFAKMPNRIFDAGIAISNLAEMSTEQVKLYLKLFDSKIKSYIYIKQWIESNNTLDGVSYHRTDFDMSEHWEKSVDRTDSVQDKFFETLWKRRD